MWSTIRSVECKSKNNNFRSIGHNRSALWMRFGIWIIWSKRHKMWTTAWMGKRSTILRWVRGSNSEFWCKSMCLFIFVQKNRSFIHSNSYANFFFHLPYYVCSLCPVKKLMQSHQKVKIFYDHFVDNVIILVAVWEKKAILTNLISCISFSGWCEIRINFYYNNFV